MKNIPIYSALDCAISYDITRKNIKNTIKIVEHDIKISAQRQWFLNRQNILSHITNQIMQTCNINGAKKAKYFDTHIFYNAFCHDLKSQNLAWKDFSDNAFLEDRNLSRIYMTEIYDLFIHDMKTLGYSISINHIENSKKLSDAIFPLFISAHPIQDIFLIKLNLSLKQRVLKLFFKIKSYFYKE